MNLKAELLLVLRDRQIPWLAGFLILIFAAAFWSGSNEQSDLKRKAQEANEVVQQQTETLLKNLALVERGQGKDIRPIPTSPATVAHYTNPYLLMPGSALAITAVGESDIRPSLVRLGNPSDPTWVHDEILSPLALASGRFDVAFVVVVLLPLIVIAMMFRLYSAEEEGGTKFLVASGRESLWQILSKRTLIKAIMLTGSVTILFLAGVIVSTKSLPIELAVQWILLVTAYLGFWFGLCFLICCLRKSSGANIVTMVAVWVGLVILVPIGLNVLLGNPGQSLARLDANLEFRAILEHKEAGPEVVADFHKHLGVKDLPTDHGPSQFFALRHHALKAVGPEVNRLKHEAVRRDERLRAFGFLNPVLALNGALSSIAGRDVGAFRGFDRFLAETDQQRQAKFLRLRLEDRVMTREQILAIPKVVPPSHYSLPSFWNGAPVFLWCLALLLTSRFVSCRDLAI